MNRSASRASPEFPAIAFIFITGLLVRLYQLGAPSLCGDEIATFIRIHHSLLDTICLIRRSSFPPLHYAVLNLWVDLAGNSEWALRFPSAIFSSLTIVVIYKLGKELFNKETGLIAAALLVFAPFAVNYAQHDKMYALFWFLEALSFFFFFRFLKGLKSAWWPYIITSLLCCYTLYTGVLFLVVQSMIILMAGEKAEWKKWFAGQLIIIVCCTPWVWWFLCSRHEPFYLRPSGETVDYFSFFANSLLRIIDVFGNWGKINCFLYIFPLAYVCCDAFNRNKKTGFYLPANQGWLLLWIIVPVLIYCVADRLFIHAILTYRYIGFIQVPFILLVSSQIANMPALIRKILLVAVLGIAVANTYLYFKENLRLPLQDWRATMTELSRELGGNDIVVSFIDIPSVTYYYHGDTRRFFRVSERDCSSPWLRRQGILNENVHSIFVLYKQEPAPDIQLDGFSLENGISSGEIGFLHFQRNGIKK